MWPAMDLGNGEVWSWGSPRLIGGVTGTEGAQNGVSSEIKEGRKKNKKHKEEQKT